MLDYGSRSRCCWAPIRIAKQKRNGIIKHVWQCVKCRHTNIAIITKSEMQSQENWRTSFSEED